MGSSYLWKAYHYSKPLFAFFIIAMLGQGFFSYKGVQTLPFFNYGMYSEVLSSENSSVLYEISLGDSIIPFNTLSYFPEDYVQGSIHFYHELQKTDFQDPIIETIQNRFYEKIPAPMYDHVLSSLSNDWAAHKNFPRWLLKIMNDATGLKESKISVAAVSCEFRSEGFITKKKSILFQLDGNDE